MYQFDYKNLKAKIDLLGIKHRAIALKAGLKESHLCLILSGKRKCEAGEYISLCKALDVNPWEFVKEVKKVD